MLLYYYRFGRKSNGERNKLPESLKELLEDSNIKKVGSNILNDRTKLLEDYDLILPKDSYVNISTLAVARKVLTIPMSLQDLVTHMLGKKLLKPENIRLSENWTDVPLNEDQISYAALDAYAGILVYWAIFLGQDPMFDDYSPTAIEPGKKVNVYDSTGSNVIATGTVSEQISGNYREYRQAVTNGRAVVTMIDIMIPCALIPIALSKYDINGPAKRWTISEHEKDDLLVNKKNIRPFKGPTDQYAKSAISIPPSSASSSSSSSSSSLPSSVPSSSSSSASPGDYSWNVLDSTINVEEEYDEEYTQPTTLQTQASEEEEIRQSYMATLDESILKRLHKSPSSVKGDHLHCFKNLGDSMKKKNGAHATFMRGLSDSFFMVSRMDVECVEQSMRAQGLNDTEIAIKKKYFWKKKFLSHCRRTTGIFLFYFFLLFSVFSIIYVSLFFFRLNLKSLTIHMTIANLPLFLFLQFSSLLRLR